MSTEDEIKMVTVDLYGQNVAMPEAQAKLIIAGRDDNKTRMTEMQTSMETKVTAEKKAIDDAAATEARRIAEEAAGKGELDQLKNLHASELIKSQSHIKKLMINSGVSKNEKVARSALSDVADALSVNANIKLVDDRLIVTRADGTTTTFDDHLNGYLQDRPHFTTQTVPPSSGGVVSAESVGDKPTITLAEFESDRKRYGDAVGKGELLIK